MSQLTGKPIANTYRPNLQTGEYFSHYVDSAGFISLSRKEKEEALHGLLFSYRNPAGKEVFMTLYSPRAENGGHLENVYCLFSEQVYGGTNGSEWEVNYDVLGQGTKGSWVFTNIEDFVASVIGSSSNVGETTCMPVHYEVADHKLAHFTGYTVDDIFSKKVHIGTQSQIINTTSKTMTEDTHTKIVAHKIVAHKIVAHKGKSPASTTLQKARKEAIFEAQKIGATRYSLISSQNGMILEEGEVTKKVDKYADNPILSTFRAEDIEAVEMAMEMNMPTLLIGHTGLGKTTLVKALSEAHGKELVRFSVHSGITADEIIGKWLLKGNETVWQDGVLTKAMKDGKHFVMDEINACPADVLFQLHALLDDDRHIIMSEKDGDILKPHEDFRFFATMNPPEDYAGTKELNMAFLSRFTSVVMIDIFPTATEVAILERKGIQKGTAKFMVELATNLREMQKKEDISFFCGTRDIINTGLLIEKGMDTQVALRVGLLNKMNIDDSQEVVRQFGSIITPKKTVEQEALEKANEELKKSQTRVTELEREVVELSSKVGGNVTLNPKQKTALEILGAI